MNPPNPVIDKIRKLLALAGNNTSAAEAASALAKAQKIAADNGISLSEIPDDCDASSALTHSETVTRKCPATRLAAVLVKLHFGVQCQFMTCNRRVVIQIVGMHSQVQIATYVFVYLSRAMTAAWAKRDNRRLRDRESFMKGFACAVSDKLPAVFPQTGLIVSSESYIRDRLTPDGSVVKAPPAMKPTLARAAVVAGHAAGRNTSLHQAIRGTSQQLLEL